MFIDNNKQESFSWKNKNNDIFNDSTISSILQICRGTSSTHRHIHLNNILSVIRQREISFSEFAVLPIPESFIKSVLDSTPTLREQLTCQAPWCSSYEEPGSLIRTATSKKVKKDGTHLNYYLFCEKCGIEYAIDSETKTLIERGYFISIGWHKIKPLLEKGKRNKEISILLEVSLDVVLRCIVFLISNNLIPQEEFNYNFPEKPEAKIIEKFKELIHCGEKVKQIGRILDLKYSNFLYYWSLPEIKVCWLKNINPAKRIYKKDWLNKFPEVIGFLSTQPEPITIKNVCQMLGIYHESLRLQGLLPKVAEAKKKQKEHLSKERSIALKKRADEIIDNLSRNNLEITSDMVYKNIGINRTVLVRSHPEVTSYVSSILKMVKSSPLT